jgi:hypothetical protein
MNERIQELSGKALDKAVPYTWTRLDYEQVHQLLACHAELIVRECVEVVKWTPSIFPNDTILKNIKEHFGVEE